jgi:hypothetical protein
VVGDASTFDQIEAGRGNALMTSELLSSLVSHGPEASMKMFRANGALRAGQSTQDL